MSSLWRGSKINFEHKLVYSAAVTYSPLLYGREYPPNSGDRGGGRWHLSTSLPDFDYNRLRHVSTTCASARRHLLGEDCEGGRWLEMIMVMMLRQHHRRRSAAVKGAFTPRVGGGWLYCSYSLLHNKIGFYLFGSRLMKVSRIKRMHGFNFMAIKFSLPFRDSFSSFSLCASFSFLNNTLDNHKRQRALLGLA